MTPSPVAVAVHGVTWTTILVGLLNVLVSGGLVGGVVAWIKTRPNLAQIGNARRKDELDAMAERIATLEGKIETERARHEAEVAILRHSVANSNTCLDAILLLLEAAPEKAAEHAAKIRTMRQDMRDREDREKLNFAAAKIQAAAVTAVVTSKD